MQTVSEKLKEMQKVLQPFPLSSMLRIYMWHEFELFLIHFVTFHAVNVSEFMWHFYFLCSFLGWSG